MWHVPGSSEQMAQGPVIGIKMDDKERSKSRTSRLEHISIKYFNVNKPCVFSFVIMKINSVHIQVHRQSVYCAVGTWSLYQSDEGWLSDSWLVTSCGRYISDMWYRACSVPVNCAYSDMQILRIASHGTAGQWQPVCAVTYVNSAAWDRWRFAHNDREMAAGCSRTRNNLPSLRGRGDQNIS